LNLYLHLPFCPRICPYCAFPVVRVDKALAKAFEPRLLEEWTRRRPASSVETIYFGGGTPTSLSERALERIVVPVLATAAPGAEVTMECNPSTLSDSKARLLRRLGVNRLSIGAQSFDPEVLRALGRSHSPACIRACAAAARRAGIPNINLDLIFGVPGQSEDSWRASLRAALDLAPDHVSCYGLSYEEDTEFFRRLQCGEMRPAPDIEKDLFEVADEILGAAGFVHYEVSNFARPGAECRHHLDGWAGRDYLGIGPGAVSTIAAVRTRNDSIRADGSWAVAEREDLSPATRTSERIALGLRTRRGVDEVAFARDFGFDLRERWAIAIARLVEEGLAEARPPFRLTRKGWLVADEVVQLFL
jgi:oxygen-independent coproporphyrinogen-3 oxidase